MLPDSVGLPHYGEHLLSSRLGRAGFGLRPRRPHGEELVQLGLRGHLVSDFDSEIGCFRIHHPQVGVVFTLGLLDSELGVAVGRTYIADSVELG